MILGSCCQQSFLSVPPAPDAGGMPLPRTHHLTPNGMAYSIPLMGTGLSPLQRYIVGLLDGSVHHLVYSPASFHTTEELLEELEAAEMMKPGQDRKIALFTVRRACRGLCRREQMTRGDSFDDFGRKVATWQLRDK